MKGTRRGVANLRDNAMSDNIRTQDKRDKARSGQTIRWSERDKTRSGQFKRQGNE